MLIVALILFCCWVENYDKVNDFVLRILTDVCRGPTVIYWGEVRDAVRDDD